MNQKQKIREGKTNDLKLAILNDIVLESGMLLSECKKRLSEATNKDTRIKIHSMVDFYEDQKKISLWNLTEFISQNYLNGNL